MVAGPVKVQEVDHLSVEDTVDEVSHGPTQDKGEGCDQDLFSLRQSSKHHHNETDRKERKEKKEGYTKKCIASSKDAEGRPGIADIGQVEQVLDDRNRVVQRYRTVDDNLGYLIQEDNKNNKTTDEFAFGGQDGAPDLKTSEQRAQTIEGSEFFVTSRLYFQHR